MSRHARHALHEHWNVYGFTSDGERWTVFVDPARYPGDDPATMCKQARMMASSAHPMHDGKRTVAYVAAPADTPPTSWQPPARPRGLLASIRQRIAEMADAGTDETTWVVVD